MRKIASEAAIFVLLPVYWGVGLGVVYAAVKAVEGRCGIRIHLDTFNVMVGAAAWPALIAAGAVYHVVYGLPCGIGR